MAYHGRADAAPVQNRLTELKNDLSGRINVVAEEVSDVKRLLKVDLALRMGALTPAEAKQRPWCSESGPERSDKRPG